MVGAIKNIFFYRIVWEIGKSSFIAFETSRCITFSLESEYISNKGKKSVILWFYYPSGNNTAIVQWN